jgi:mono/diheme cytochrome c family protein
MANGLHSPDHRIAALKRRRRRNRLNRSTITMRFIRDAVITILVLVLALVIAGYAGLRGRGLSAEASPGPVERAVASRLARLAIPEGARSQQNPLSDEWRAAADHYQEHCAICHGSDGRGQTEIGEHMYPKVPDLASPGIRGMTDGDLFYVIQNGVRWTGMPAWRTEHDQADSWRLVAFIRHVQSER